MKKSLVAALIFAALIFAGLAYWAGREVTIREASSQAVFPPANAAPAPKPKPIPVAAAAAPSAPAADANAQAAGPDTATVALANAIETLTSPSSTYAQRRDMWAQIRKAGCLDDVIAGLKAAQQQNPNDAEIPAALGETLIYKIGALMQSGGSENDIDILGLQADQDFNTALGIDPTNWDAQFFKAAAQAHWPPGLNMGPGVITQLTNLAAQQDTMATQPQFAQTYVLLGEQYQAAGQLDKAAQAWQTGFSKYPFSAALQRKISNAAKP